MSFQKIPENEYRKLLFQARGQYIAILNCFNCHGLDVYVEGAIDECMRVTENFGQAVRGSKKPIHIIDKPKGRVTE